MVTVNNTPIHLSDLNDAFLAVDSAKLECDGHTLMLSHALMEAKIPHLRFLGKVTVKGCDFVLSPLMVANRRLHGGLPPPDVD
jgi:hypothetical protein